MSELDPKKEVKPIDIDEEDDTTITNLPMKVFGELEFFKRLNIFAVELQKFKITVLSFTEPSGWNKFGDTYRLNDAGAKMAARPLGIIWYGLEGPDTSPTITEQPQGDGTYAMVVEGFFARRNSDGKISVSIPVRGRAFSDDQFYVARKTKELKKLHNISWDQPLPSDIPVNLRPEEVREKALANWIARGVAAVSGLKFVTEEMFESARQINPRLDFRKIKGAEFERGKDTQAKKETRESAISGVAPEKLKELKEVVAEIVHLSGKSEGDVLKAVTKYYTTYERLTEKFIDLNIKNAKAMLDELLDAENASSNSPPPPPESPRGGKLL